MSEPISTLRLGIAGLGTVGAGLIQLVERQTELRLAGKLEVTAVSARNRSRDRGVDISNYRWYDDPVELAQADDVDVVVELIGGSDGPAKLTVEAALAAGKAVVTANKALIAERGLDIASQAEARDAHLLFEAAVAGAIPIVRALRNSLSGMFIDRVSGILNGTCNYILTEMLEGGAGYADVLADAQRLGYAEADPYLDVSGMDAAHKVLIMATIAFGAKPDFENVYVEGISEIDSMDLVLADKFGYRVKLVGEAFRTQTGVGARVAPVLVHVDHPLASIGGALNAAVVEGEPVGRLTFTGPGAGAGPTASAVMGDIARLFEGRSGPPFGTHTSELKVPIEPVAKTNTNGPYFIGARLADKSGAFAGLTDALAEAGVSIDKVMQDSAGENDTAPVAIITHPCDRASVDAAIKLVSEKNIAADSPRLFRVEN